MADIAALTALIEPEAEALGLKIVRIAMFGGTSDTTLHDRNPL
jgi:ribosome maturation factor RimP